MIMLGSFFLFLHENIFCIPFEVPHKGTSNEYLQHMFFYGELEKSIPEL